MKNIAAIFLLLLLLAKVHAQVKQVRPNIVFIMADDLGYGELGCYGQQKIKTPNIDRLAAQGKLFTQFYANPVCAPTRCSLLTGKDLAHSYIRDNYEMKGFDFTDEGEYGQLPLPANTITLPHLLHANGYTTALIGKWGLGNINTTGTPRKQGFDYFFGYLDQKQAHNYYPTHLWRNEEKVALTNKWFSPHQALQGDASNAGAYEKYRGSVFACDTIANDAIQFIKTHKDKPFFLEFSPTLPHVSLQVTDEALKKYAGVFSDTPFTAQNGNYLPNYTPRATYAAMITLLDDYVGRLMATLHETGLDNNTLVIFTSDNGAAMPGTGGADTKFFNSNGSLRGYKGDVYEGAIREPFIACWPGKIQAAATSNHVAAIWDMLPTFCSLLNISLSVDGAGGDVQINGISLLPELLGDTAQQKQHEYLYWENHSYNGGEQAVRWGKWKAVRQQAHKDADAPVELYDLENDISEQHNVALQNPIIVEKMRAFMKARELSHMNEWNFEYKSK